jgi:type IV secretory pathway VirB2 component (pilin)
MRYRLTRPSLTAATIVAVAAMMLLWPQLAHAASTGGSLPWEAPLTKLSNSIKGPVAYAISLIGTVVTGAMLVWGGEINEFARRLIMLVLVISLIIFASNILTTLFNASAVV